MVWIEYHLHYSRCNTGFKRTLAGKVLTCSPTEEELKEYAEPLARIGKEEEKSGF
jgi:hypothetical protein